MAFAIATALWNGPIQGRGELGAWLLVAVLGYAAKDRIKASLQNAAGKLLSNRFADRRWRIRDRNDAQLGYMDERSGFASFEDLPEDVLGARRITRQHPIEEEARPESVLWHKKSIVIGAEKVGERYAGLLEVFRADLRRWLVNTDEPKQRVLVADPLRGCIDEVVAPRVYNIAIVYRLKGDGALDARWRRARVVVTRKGILRIEQIA
jgi:hypothetical protein